MPDGRGDPGGALETTGQVEVLPESDPEEADLDWSSGEAELLAVFADRPDLDLGVDRDDERALLSVFEETGAEILSSGAPETVCHGPVARPLHPPSSVSPRRHVDPDPLSMTALQQLVSRDRRLTGLDQWESRWMARRRVRHSESAMLKVAFYVSVALVTGAVAFVKIEDSTMSSARAADLQWRAAMEAREVEVEKETQAALATATLALTQPTWMDLLSFIKDSRRFLPEIRDHYSRWSYAPFHEPRLEVIDRVIDERGLAGVHLRVDGLQPWASRIVMEKVGGVFKIDWHSFEGRFDSDESLRESRGSVLGEKPFELRMEDHPFDRPANGGQGMEVFGRGAFFGAARAGEGQPAS